MTDDQYIAHRVSSWDNKGPSTTSESTRFTQNAYSVPTSPSNYLMPKSRNNSQIYPQFSNDERRLQQYQQPKPDSGASETFQPTKTNSNQTSKLESITQHVTTTRVIGVLIGLVLTGIPLGVMTTLFVQLSSSSSNTTATNASSSSSSSGSSSVTVSLPYQCTTYSQLNDATRLVTYSSCCYTDCSYSGWYRVTGSSGTRLVTSPVSINSCGSYYPGWYNGSLPNTAGATTYGTECINYNGNICHPSYSVYPVLATNCSGFYVFYLIPLYCGCCSLYPRYCTV